ncbi:MAG: PIN domain-containing protein [Aquificae bacterium]|nr:PIN domain-containing protein [Aquificota bacterium]
MRFFIDSSIIIEGLKNNDRAVSLLQQIKELDKKELAINEVVWSEVVYQLVIKRKLDPYSTFGFLRNFDFLFVNREVLSYAERFVDKHNLKPNDALILATCKHYKVSYLLSLDEDFKEPCEKEGITLIDSAEKLKRALSKSG